jgi:rod shape-determining protein MreD
LTEVQIVSFLIIGIILITFQTTVLQFLPTWLGAPDLVFILIAFLAYRFEVLKGLLLSFLLGWMMDVISGIYLGTYLIEYLLFFIALNTLTLNSPLKESAYQVPLVGVFYYLVQFLLYFTLSIMVNDSMVVWSWSRVLRETIILTVATIPCFLLFNSFNEFLLKRKAMKRSTRQKAGNRYR